MSTCELLHIVQNLHRQALDAYMYKRIIQQYRDNLKEYQKEMRYSSAFYSVIYQSLHESLMMCLARIYDWNTNSLTIRTLKENISLISLKDMDQQIQEMYRINNVFRHDLRPCEEVYFPSEVESTKRIYEVLEEEYRCTHVDLTLDQMKELYIQRFKDLQEANIIHNMMERRNKMYAHNDQKANFDFKTVGEKYPLNYDEVDAMIEFALDVTEFVIRVLTGKIAGRYPSNMDDWKWTLEMVREAEKHKQ